MLALLLGGPFQKGCDTPGALIGIAKKRFGPLDVVAPVVRIGLMPFLRLFVKVSVPHCARQGVGVVNGDEDLFAVLLKRMFEGSEKKFEVAQPVITLLKGGGVRKGRHALDLDVAIAGRLRVVVAAVSASLPVRLLVAQQAFFNGPELGVGFLKLFKFADAVASRL